jgi:hypothetical protein
MRTNFDNYVLVTSHTLFLTKALRFLGNIRPIMNSANQSVRMSDFSLDAFPGSIMTEVTKRPPINKI